MLVLSRKLGEAIIVNGEITVSVVGVRGRRVRLAIEAPEQVPVRRAEVLGHTPGQAEAVSKPVERP